MKSLWFAESWSPRAKMSVLWEKSETWRWIVRKSRDSKPFFLAFATICGVVPGVIGYCVMQFTNSRNPELEAQLRSNARPDSLVCFSFIPSFFFFFFFLLGFSGFALPFIDILVGMNYDKVFCFSLHNPISGFYASDYLWLLGFWFWGFRLLIVFVIWLSATFD